MKFIKGKIEVSDEIDDQRRADADGQPDYVYKREDFVFPKGPESDL